ncbi:MAG TPA: type IV toxin-antitoxin system AbiEi family antitoxin domain-containing protein [Solirubrobacterales bacterium]|nr:type IV toxin-antitoxin system AbiEi family antitoxin domain-containing protein [Solirubrobacterales bacterium]
MDGEVEIGARTGAEFQPQRFAAELARRQHGVVHRSQLIRAGATPKEIKTLIRRGALHPVHRGVYAVGHSLLSREGRWMAAVLAGGPAAVLSHESAGMNWQLLSPFPSLPSITAPTKGRRRPGITFHSGALPADETTTHDGIPTTTVARTLFDLASVLDPYRLEQALAQAELRRYADSPSLPQLIARYPGHRGVASLKRALGAGAAERGVTESPLEDLFQEFLIARGLERPELNPAVDLGHRVVRPDGLYRQLGLVIELDGRSVHQRRRAFESDRLRDRELLVAGLRTVRVTSEQLRQDPDGLEGDLVALGVARR